MQRVAALADINMALARDALLAFIDERGRAQIQSTAVPGASSKDIPPWTKAQLAYRQRLTIYLDEASEDDFIETILAAIFAAWLSRWVHIVGHALGGPAAAGSGPNLYPAARIHNL
jgi:hypothetical protein